MNKRQIPRALAPVIIRRLENVTVRPAAASTDPLDIEWTIKATVRALAHLAGVLFVIADDEADDVQVQPTAGIAWMLAARVAGALLRESV